MVNNDSVTRRKCFEFALKIIALGKKLQESHEFILSRQIVRSATAIGALTEEAIGAESKKDFLHKISIAYKEARETRYWLQLLSQSDYGIQTESLALLEDIESIIRLLGATISTLKRNIAKQ